MSQLHRTALLLRWLGSAWQAAILGLLYSENSKALRVIVHAKTICFSQHDMVYLEIVTIHLPCPLCWDCTAEHTLSSPLGLYSGNVPPIGTVRWAIKLLRWFTRRSKGCHLSLKVKAGAASFLDPYCFCKVINWEERHGAQILFVREEKQLTTHSIRKGGLQFDELREAELTSDRQ
jgi:hypothetical protein